MLGKMRKLEKVVCTQPELYDMQLSSVRARKKEKKKSKIRKNEV